MGKKRRPTGEWADQRRLEGRIRAPLVKEKWPQVLSLTFEFEYPGASRQPSKFNVGPDDKAFFDYHCLHAHLLRGEPCIQGGFDLTKHVCNTVETGESEYSEELICEGLRYGSGGFYSCGQRLRWRVMVRYSE
jgi:hypothetical protein